MSARDQKFNRTSMPCLKVKLGWAGNMLLDYITPKQAQQVEELGGFRFRKPNGLWSYHILTNPSISWGKTTVGKKEVARPLIESEPVDHVASVYDKKGLSVVFFRHKGIVKEARRSNGWAPMDPPWTPPQSTMEPDKDVLDRIAFISTAFLKSK